MGKGTPNRADPVKFVKAYLKTNIADPKNGDRGFVQLANVVTTKRFIIDTELLTRQGTIRRFKFLYEVEDGTKATTVRFTLLGTNDPAADPATSRHIIFRTLPLTIGAVPSILDDFSPQPPIEFETVDEEGPKQTPKPEVRDGQLQMVVEHVGGGAADSTYLFQLKGNDDD